MCLNARSIVNKMGELRLMVEDVEPDIIGITETWTKPDMGNAEFSLKGYQMFRKDREVRRGGGVALYIKQSIQQGLKLTLAPSPEASGNRWG